ncbi:hypothetical protein JDV02_007347 [Purpureocillium takamizusanense]|uniref:Uncharacterized protein n=1 Tax=Purpureocillium takamizusanense TaxID=2060973 RepID=A0A9Q8VDM9_9HYPO|nr:uncharacterized protein JDV02_007347 [Purpureocillium takamizusanense]UNI21351.1 hypothetical protein JDV02_007347 [Purpureocillium takamizusanense]
MLAQCTRLQTVHLADIQIERPSFCNTYASVEKDVEKAVGDLALLFTQSIHRLRRLTITGNPVPEPGLSLEPEFTLQLDRAGYKFEWNWRTPLGSVLPAESFPPFKRKHGVPCLSLEGKERLESAWHSLCSNDQEQNPINQKHLQECYQRTRLRVFGESRCDLDKTPFVSGRTRAKQHMMADPAQLEAAFAKDQNPFNRNKSFVHITDMRLQSDGVTIEVCSMSKDGLLIWSTLESRLSVYDEDGEIFFMMSLFSHIDCWCKVSLHAKLNVAPHLLLDFVKDRAWVNEAAERDALRRITVTQRTYESTMAEAQAVEFFTSDSFKAIWSSKHQ